MHSPGFATPVSSLGFVTPVSSRVLSSCIVLLTGERWLLNGATLLYARAKCSHLWNDILRWYDCVLRDEGTVSLVMVSRVGMKMKRYHLLRFVVVCMAEKCVTMSCYCLWDLEGKMICVPCYGFSNLE